jgi:hypothetical protein
MSDPDMPVAVWSGEIHGIKVHVLDNGQRIIDADDLRQLFSECTLDSFDMSEFAKAFKSFMDGSAPTGQRRPMTPDEMDDKLLAELDEAREESAVLRAKVAELEKTIEQMSEYATDASDALKRVEEYRVAGLRAAKRATPNGCNGEVSK